MTPTEAADLLGVSRQTVNQLIQTGKFKSLHVIGPGSRPQYVLSRGEVEVMGKERVFRRSPGKETGR